MTRFPLRSTGRGGGTIRESRESVRPIQNKLGEEKAKSKKRRHKKRWKNKPTKRYALADNLPLPTSCLASPLPAFEMNRWKRDRAKKEERHQQLRDKNLLQQSESQRKTYKEAHLSFSQHFLLLGSAVRLFTLDVCFFVRAGGRKEIPRARRPGDGRGI